MVTVLGAQPFRLEGVDRTLFHAAAVLVSNQVVALASAAGRLWTLAGLPDHLGREALSPLLLAAAANVARLELGNALTGPLAEGDVATVEAHLGRSPLIPRSVRTVSPRAECHWRWGGHPVPSARREQAG